MPDSHDCGRETGIPPSCWRMDRVFRVVWSDREASTGYLEFIPTQEKSPGLRSYPRLEGIARQRSFAIFKALSRIMDAPIPLPPQDDVAIRLKNIRFNDSDKGTMGTGTYHARVPFIRLQVKDPKPEPSRSPLLRVSPPPRAPFGRPFGNTECPSIPATCGDTYSSRNSPQVSASIK